MARILVVDDEPDIRTLVADYLGACGFSVETASDTAGLADRLAAGPVDLIVLDVNMPGETGLVALARLRAAGDRTAVILLTAASRVPERVAGLADGADDYVVKPFEPRELLARVRAVLRRVGPAAPPAAAPEPLLRIGRVRFDRAARRLLAEDGAEIALTAMEFDLLSVLVRHPRQILSRARLAELAHGRPLGPGDRSIDIRVTRLRQKIGENPEAPQTLRTVFGEGYVFDPET